MYKIKKTLHKSSFLIFCFFALLMIACVTQSIHYPTVPSQDAKMVALGKRLFFDTRLSANGTKSCATCHAPQFGFTDGYRRSSGIEADETMHNAPSLLNTVFYKRLTWANPNTHNYEQQMLGPLFKKHPPEMGLDPTNLNQLAFLKQDDYYKKAFVEIFKNEQSFDFKNVITAIAAYESTLVSFDAKYDEYRRGNKNAISASAKRGEALFFSEAFQCSKCHPYPLFTDADKEDCYHNIGYFEDKNLGIYAYTNQAQDKGKFRTPTLRNIAITAPYMHDGGIERLEQVLNHFETLTPNPDIQPIKMTNEQRKDLLNFLYTLTDSTIFVRYN